MHKDIITLENIKKIICQLQNNNVNNNEFTLITNETKKTMIIYNSICFKHGLIEEKDIISKIKTRKYTVENPDRLSVLLQPPFGILLSDFFINNCQFKQETKLAAIADIVRVHDFAYVNNIKNLCGEMKKNNFTGIGKYGKIINLS